ERLDERQTGRTNEVVARQTEGALSGLKAAEVSRLVIAYEPVWAIGTGKAATPEDANEVSAYIRHVISGLCGKDSAEQVRIQYGGSVKPANIGDFMAQTEVDGALVGGASLEAESFAGIVKFGK
ncbi:MAG: triose-phosphate isomerase, partial [Actinobacteria bacterium]|nr:triose-phosphate isomerase [Actinomycetota bacterium]